ncbi:glycosyltransferase family 4 protein [Kineosporia babensis]|uniref:Glycosyltransferase family 4 protein n=1 Tax=Kineosporia babensis TaxID=499548 RepID=A0A9X1NBY4_9ACTN|nr:glycosyltransferase family 4 protein [Kineosporia babensis]MCD5311285.1 glycosyltransferase family 4 protein [Kineosporia babensis]
MPRLAVVSDAVMPYHTGGKEARYAALLPRLARSGLQIDLYTMKWWGSGPDPVHDGVALHALSPMLPLYRGERRSVLQAVVFALCSMRLLLRRFDALEADAIPFLQLFPLKLVALIRRKPLLVTWHELWGRDYWRQYLGPAGVIAAAIEAYAVRLPDHIFAASEGTAERIRVLRGERGGVSVVPNGLDLQHITAAPAGEPSDVLCVGRLLAHKKVDVVLEALAQLPGLRLLVLGQGPELARLQALALNLGVAERVEFRPPVPDRLELLGLIKAARVLAFPSEREGFGMVALEALACGTPVVTSSHPDNEARRLVQPGVNGVVGPAQAAAVAEGIAQVLSAGAPMRAAARAGVADSDWETIADRLAGSIHTLLGATPPVAVRTGE